MENNCFSHNDENANTCLLLQIATPHNIVWSSNFALLIAILPY